MNERLAAIDFIAECLRVRPSAEDTERLGRSVVAEQVPWGPVLCLANGHMLTPTLAMALQDRGLGNVLPSDINAYLQRLYELNLRRNMRLRIQLFEVVSALNSIDVEPVLLKGAASLVTRTYVHPGSRIMTDLDLLVPPARVEACQRQLHALGYGVDEKDRDWPVEHHHTAPLRRTGDYATVELHHSLIRSLRTGLLFGARLSAEETGGLTNRLIDESEAIAVSGLSLRLPGPEFCVLNLVLHSAFMDRQHRDGALPLRALHELALVLTQHRDELDWAMIRASFRDQRKIAILDDWVYLAHRLYGCPLPTDFRRRPHARIHFCRCRLQARWGIAASFRAFARLSPGKLRDPRMHCP